MSTQRRRVLMFALLLTLSLLTLPSSAADLRWSSKSQPGASITALVTSPSDASHLYLAAYGAGVFRSVDGGETWQAINAGIAEREIVSLAIDPIVPSTLYAGTDSGATFRSLNGGESWMAMSSFTEKAIHLAVAAERGTIYALADGSIHRSIDAGATWSERWNGVGGHVDALSTVPSNPSKLFAGTSTGLFTSADRGDTWSRVPIPGVEHVGAIAVSDDGRMIYVNSGNFHTSTDGGATWTTVAFDGPQNPSGMTIDRSSSSAAWATISDPAGLTHNLYRTTDSGRTWRRLDIVEEIQALLPAGDAIYAATSSGLYKSINAAEGWMPVQSGLDAGPVMDIALDGANPNVMVVAAPGGVFKTTTAGSEWFRSDDLKQPVAVAIDPTNSAVVFASSYASARKTEDGGATWTDIHPNPGKLAGARALAVDPANPSTVYAVLVGDGLSKSIDDGSTFSLINSGLLEDFYYGFDASALAIAPSRPSTVYASSVGISVSVNGGGSWLPVSPGPPVYWASALAVDPKDPALVYAGAFHQPGLYRSRNGGWGWEQLKNGFTSESITDVIVDPSDGRNLYIATKDAGVYKSTDRGDTWTVLSEGLPKQVNALAIDSSGRFLAAATAAGVFTLGEVMAFPPALRAERLQSDPSRVPRLLNQLRALGGSSAAYGHNASGPGVVFAVAGNVAGALGTYFRSDVTLLNGDASGQQVIAVWLAAGSDGTDAPSLRLTLPSSAITVTDFVGKMGVSGLGSLLVIGVDAEMNVDGNADLTGFSRIWTAGPGGRGTVSQSFPAVDIASLGGAVAASAIGLRMDADFRTNVGIVNLDATSHTFLVTFTGEQRSGTLSVHVEPFSMRQVPVPEGTYGALAALFTVTGGDFPWTAYGASVDNLTGDGWASKAVAVRPSGSPRLGEAGIAGTVYDQGGGCLLGAMVEVLDGALAGKKWTQKECEGYWDYEGVLGYSISLPAGTKVRIRASMPGYRSKEETFIATTDWAAGKSNFFLDPN